MPHKFYPGLLIISMFTTVACLPAFAEETEEHGAGHATSSDRFRITSLRNWLFAVALPEGDQSETLGVEIDAEFGIGDFDVKNINYFEVMDYPRTVPGMPIGNPYPGLEPATGIGDFMSGYWFTRKGAPHGKHHFAWGFAAQLPTASNESLGSGKWSLGPSIDYEYENGRFFGGFIAIQFWSVAGDSDRKDVNMMMIKPFAYYELNEKWDLVYEPYGISIYWDKPSDQRVYLPLGGGVQRSAQFGSVPMVFSLQYQNYVLRSPGGSKYEYRLLVEFDF